MREQCGTGWNGRGMGEGFTLPMVCDIGDGAYTLWKGGYGCSLAERKR